MMVNSLDLLRVFQVAILLLGVVVVYYSQKGYRKTKSKSLLFLALGFVFVTIGAALAGLLFEFLNYDLIAAEAIEAFAEMVGFSLIVYSIVGTKD
jgi:hypothetical protein